MVYESNPYTPSFGTAPLAYIHRYEEESKIKNEFFNANGVPKSFMIIGARGSGKTVLMHEMANQLDEFPEWVVVRMNPNTDMMVSLMRKLSGHKRVLPALKSAEINLSVFKINIEKSDTPIQDVEDAITEMVKALKADDKRLLITVDEATNTESMKTFASCYQNLIGQRLPVYLLMTGLYENINNLKNEDNLTFLYRMPRILLPPLNLEDVADSYCEAFQIERADAEEMSLYTKGYSYAFQLLGNLTWEHRDFHDTLDEYQNILYETVYDKMWQEMSPLDKDSAYSIATARTNKIKDIRDVAGRSVAEFSPYRDRLIKKGIAFSYSYGEIDLVLPFFKRYITKHYNGALKMHIPADLPDDL